MKDLSTLEKEFFLAITGKEYSHEINQGSFSYYHAKAAAGLCERKMREAIELARKGMNYSVDLKYTKEEIIEKLSNPK